MFHFPQLDSENTSKKKVHTFLNKEKRKMYHSGTHICTPVCKKWRSRTTTGVLTHRHTQGMNKEDVLLGSPEEKKGKCNNSGESKEKGP